MVIGFSFLSPHLRIAVATPVEIISGFNDINVLPRLKFFRKIILS
jgi:hypothetical protein